MKRSINSLPPPSIPLIMLELTPTLYGGRGGELVSIDFMQGVSLSFSHDCSLRNGKTRDLTGNKAVL